MTDMARLFQAFLAPAIFVSGTGLLNVHQEWLQVIAFW
jgi:hypothetical protein